QRLRLLGRMQLPVVAPFEALLAGAQRYGPVGADLDILVAGLEGLVVEGVLPPGGVARGPDQRLVRVGETPPTEIRHRIGLAPDYVVENREAEILQYRADAKDVVVGPDHPQGGVRLHPPPARCEPSAGEIIVGGEVRELVPVVADGIDARIVGALEIALE